jgi:hypothetical protein
VAGNLARIGEYQSGWVSGMIGRAIQERDLLQPAGCAVFLEHFPLQGWILLGGAAVQQCSSDATMHDAGREAFLI